MNPVVASAWPRAGLLGNPSDLYGGRGIGFTFEDYRADVELRPRFDNDTQYLVMLATVPELAMPQRDPGPEAPILQAARVMMREVGLSDDDQDEFGLKLQCDIPQQVGLSGSSAIIIAAMRAMAGAFEIELDPAQLAELALRCETELMGIAAGPMDRMVQAHEGLVLMDFESGEVQSLDPQLMPPIAILMDRNPGQDSGSVHSPVRQRWEEGDPEVRSVMAEYRPLVETGLRYLEAGDIGGLKRCVDRNFDLRAQIFPIGKRDRRVIDRVRSLGAAAKFCGSGGAILAVHESEDLLNEICLQVVGDGFTGIRPRVTQGASE